MLKQRPSSRSSPSPSRCPCILILTDSDSLCADSLVLTRILEREAPRLPGLNVTAVGLGDRHDAGLLHVLGDLRSVCSEGNRNGRGSYFYAGCPKGAVVAITEGVGQWLAPVVAREAVLTVHADIYHNPDDGTAAAAAAGTAGAVWLQGMFEDEEGESDAKAWLPGEMQDVPGFFEKVLIKNRRVLRLDLGSLPNGSVQRVMIKTRLPVVRGAGASKELLTRQKVAFCKLRYWDVTGGGGSSSILREQTLQVKVLRSRHRRAESI